MISLAVRAISVKNNNDSDKTSEIRFMVLKLPDTNVFTGDNDAIGSGVWFFVPLFCFKCFQMKLILFNFVYSYKFRTIF